MTTRLPHKNKQKKPEFAYNMCSCHEKLQNAYEAQKHNRDLAVQHKRGRKDAGLHALRWVSEHVLFRPADWPKVDSPEQPLN